MSVDYAQIGEFVGAAGAGVVALVHSYRTALKVKTVNSEAKTADTNATTAKTEAEGARASADNAMHKAVDALAKAEEALGKAQIGWLELQLRVYLSSRRDQIHLVMQEMEAIRRGREPKDLSAEDRARGQDLMPRFKSSHEDFLGALEQACRFYRDGKVNAEGFRRMYDDEVRKVATAPTSSPFHEFMHPKETSKFRAVWAVYKEWFDLEKDGK